MKLGHENQPNKTIMATSEIPTLALWRKFMESYSIFQFLPDSETFRFWNLAEYDIVCFISNVTNFYFTSTENRTLKSYHWSFTVALKWKIVKNHFSVECLLKFKKKKKKKKKNYADARKSGMSWHLCKCFPKLNMSLLSF